MYVCLCNAITDRDFRAHAAHAECAGCSVSAVYRSLGKKPQCGKCVPFVRQLLRQVSRLRRGCLLWPRRVDGRCAEHGRGAPMFK